MKCTDAYLAIDLGAESGRAIVGVLRDGALQLKEAHRFSHAPLFLPSGVHWDVAGVWREVLRGLECSLALCEARGWTLKSVGVDSWGVDFSLISAGGEVLGLPHAYRDPHHVAAYDHALNLIHRHVVYETTGIQMMPINTLYQLVGLRLRAPAMLEAADRIAFIPDLFHFFLTGVVTNERTIASTSQMMHPGAREWAISLLQQLNLPTNILADVVDPGKTIGSLCTELSGMFGLDDEVRVIAPPAHDTASAVAAVPGLPNESWCYLSSGTWSLLGAELDEPVITRAAMDANFTNEAGAPDTIRFHKNIIGLWLVQEVRRAFQDASTSYDYSKLTEFAVESPPFRTLLDTKHLPLMQPGNMPQKIAAFAQQTSQQIPQTIGEIIRCCLESLAFAYADALDELETVLDRRFDIIHVVGGGSRNELLNQMTADATGRIVLAGPDEATAIGNIIAQAIGCGAIEDFAEARRIVRASTKLRCFEPRNADSWNQTRDRWRDIVAKRKEIRCAT